jgi:virulence factor Mce-like protein
VLTFTGGDDSKHLVAHFPRTVSVYEGSDVRVLGVPVGKVEKVEPSGTDVAVTVSYPADVSFPKDARAVIVAPSVVGDRFIQITDPYVSGPKLADNAVLALDHTRTPLELDQIYQSLDELIVALGPDGANKDGALSDLLRSTAQNFSGQGEKFNSTIHEISKLTGTLDSNREELFSTAKRLEDFLGTLANNDKTVRAFNQSLSDVSGVLAGERQELAATLKNLSVALEQVSGFVKKNEGSLGRNIRGLDKVAKVLVRQRASLDEILSAAPVALVNLGQTYNPQAGTLDARADLLGVTGQLQNNPGAVLCGLLNNNALCNVVNNALPRAGALEGVKAIPPDPFDPTLGGLVEAAR